MAGRLGWVMVEFEAPLWRWAAREQEWAFVSVPADWSEDIAEATADVRRGFGAVRVVVRIGATTWRTSIFPSGDGTYALPVKQAVRRAEGLDLGDRATVHLEVL